MTMNDLKGRYMRLSAEIESVGGTGGNSQARLARLTFELDQLDEQLVELKRLARSAPTLRDVVPWAEPMHRPHGVERRASAR
jgi:uncharacterized protein involved in exopolysaccharide biosynthesis